MPEFDHTPGEERIKELLTDSLIGWLGTVRPDRLPHLVPVWFYWTGTRLLITAEPGSRKVSNLRRNPAVSFALDDSRGGREPVILAGRVELGDLANAGREILPYFDKYRAAMATMNWSEAEARATHNTLIQVHVDRFISF